MSTAVLSKFNDGALVDWRPHSPLLGHDWQRRLAYFCQSLLWKLVRSPLTNSPQRYHASAEGCDVRGPICVSS
jgi:hypothetical protein